MLIEEAWQMQKVIIESRIDNVIPNETNLVVVIFY